MYGIPDNVPEIVAPAGNLEKLKIAVQFGADAVYFGGEEHNLRVQSDNFSLEDIGEAVRYCAANGVKSIFLMNSFLHEKDIASVRRYIDAVRNFRFDAIIISDPGMMALIREAGIESDIHLSTQMSTLNHLSVRFWHRAGIGRIVLGREAAIEEIRMIKENTDARIEVFVHGAMCIAYSGRCMLSRYLSGRDANRGDCTQSCRWRYSLVEENRPGSPLGISENAYGTEILSSKDLCLIERIGEYRDAGVDAFKIEGRMKSLYYVANTTRIYRHATRLAGSGDFSAHLPFYLEELDLISHRPYTDDPFNEFKDTGFTNITYIKNALFLGYKTGSAHGGDGAMVKIFNPIRIDETIEAIFPLTGAIRDGTFTVREIIDADDRQVDTACPGRVYRLCFDRELADNAVLRRRL